MGVGRAAGSMVLKKVQTWLGRGKGAIPLGVPEEVAAAGGGGLLSMPAEPVTAQKLLEHVYAGQVLTAVQLAPAAYATWWVTLFREDPNHVYVETALVLLIVYLIFSRKSTSKKTTSLTKREIDELVAEWQPAPLVPALTPAETHRARTAPIVDKFEGARVKLVGDDHPALNLVSFDFLGMAARPELKEGAADTLTEYGCGSCGPRGFYGSLLPHLTIENKVAAFMGTEGAISYSDTASTVTSTIPAFAKRGDLLIVDAGVQEAVVVGAELSRATVKFFKHNDMAHLDSLLQQVAADDKRLGRDARKQRRFILSEALFRNYGDLAPLADLVQIKTKYGYRLILDECLSFGTLGATGRGLSEHAGMSINQIDITTVSAAFSLASIGGLCIGSFEVVDHQRLSGAGYCFSASAPPFVSTAAAAALDVLANEPQLLAALRHNAEVMRAGIMAKVSGFMTCLSAPESPIIHLALAGPNAEMPVEQQQMLLEKIVAGCFQRHVLITFSRRKRSERERLPGHAMPLTLRLVVRADLTAADVKLAVTAVTNAVTAVLKHA